MLKSIGLGLFLSNLVVSAVVAEPAEPWPAGECEALAQAVQTATHIPVSMSVEVIRKNDLPEGAARIGKACVVKGQATGLDQVYVQVESRARAVSKGWKAITEAEADGSGESSWGFRRGRRDLFVSLSREPPATCGDEPADSCEAPSKFWTWKVKAIAYQR